MRLQRLLPLLALAFSTCGPARGTAPAAAASPGGHLDRITLPPGFHIALYATVPGARSLTIGPKGTVFVGTQDRKGKVYALRDRNHDGVAEDVITIASGLDTPNGVAVRDGALFVAENARILRFDGIEEKLDAPPGPAVVYGGLPTERSHGWKFIAFGPDGLLYVPIGAPCNLCDREAPFASISRMKQDGTGFETYVRGVRNTVGFDWDASGQLWFTDNGRDMMGDDLPPDELNRITKAGQHFGYPYCHAGDLADPEFGPGHPCADYVPPVRKLDAHVAAIGMRFYRGAMFPSAYKGQIFIAEHGSWNRSKKSGYRVMLVKVVNGAATSYEPFAQGWLQGEAEWGRPVDVQELPDGSLLISDDKAGAVYRVTYSK
jgi:glucose/arabinose dehydrogenase